MESTERHCDKCELCDAESSQLVPRVIPVEIEVSVCRKCAAELGASTLTKAERRKMLQEASYQWAIGLHGKNVMVFWDEDKHPVFCGPQSTYSARGAAYSIQNASGGWGQIRVDIDPSENHRIHRNPRYPNYGIIDDQQYGLFLNAVGDGNWYTLVSWGCRKTVKEHNVAGLHV